MMDDARIRQLADEVLAAVRSAPAEREQGASVEARLTALESAVARLAATGPAVPSSTVVRHPSLRLLDVPGGVDRCILEPDQPCEKSGRCRAFGY